MAARKAELKLANGLGTIEIDGQAVRGVRSIGLTSEAGDIARLTLDLVLHEVEVDGEMSVTVPDKTRETLLALGWTPPEGA